MLQKTQPSIVLLMIGMAIILAAGLILGVSAIRNRPQSAEDAANNAAEAIPEVVTVNDQQITLRRDSSQTVQIIGLVAAPAQPEAVQPEATPADNVEQPPAQDVAPTEAPPPTAEPAQENVPVATAVPPPPAVESIVMESHTVIQGETLYSISLRPDTSIALMAEYGIAQDHLVPGTTIQIPVGNDAYCLGNQPYAVGEGDTAFSIGHRFGISAETLQTINNLDENFTIKVAEILCVPQ
ncbi:MAG: LysM peptidoglycan-binding domain-containing protein [Chloroflexi bacterium]|nr:LysM peptidoglycan-binding domain-containing protein [Chloroflexota bacterium]